MQQGVPSGDVFEPSASVTLGALSVDASSVSVDRELPDPFGTGGFSAATGTVEATHGDDVARVSPTPWDVSTVWPPAPESAARIALNVGPGEVQSLTGRVTDVSGGTDARAVSTEIADKYQTLDRQISWDALSDMMPHPVEGEQPRYIGLHSMFLTDRIFRHCGWFATPPPLGYTVFSVPAMGTMWPEVGDLDTCRSYMDSQGGMSPYFNASDWGVGVNRVDARYTLPAYYSLNDRPHMEMAVLTDDITGSEGQGTNMYMDATTAGGQRFRITWTPTTVNVWTTNPDGGSVLAAQGSRVVGALIYVKVDRVSATSVRCELRIGGDLVNTRTVTVHPNVVSQPLTNVWIRGDMMGGGFQIAYPGSTAGQLDDWSPNAKLHKSGTSHQLRVVPPVQGENCADLLQQQCEAEGGVFWIDETGVMQWWHLWYLEREPNRANLSASDHVTDGGFTWSHNLSSVKSRVSVKWKAVSRSLSSRSKITLWQGSGTTMEDGDAEEAFIECPDEEVWLRPDIEFTRIGDGASGGATIAEFNNGNRSWWGGVVQDGDEWAYPDNGSLAFVFERITDDTFKYTMRWAGSGRVESKTPNAAATSNVSRNKRSLDLPILRGKGKATFTDMEYVAAQTGPETAPEHVIDAGWWVQSEEQAQRVADYAAARLCIPHPELSSMSLVMIPGIQLGDIVTVTDDQVARITVRGIVTADSRQIDADMGVTHTVTIRPLTVTRNGVTWQEWADFVRPETWQGWGEAQQPRTWTQWGSNPLS